MAKLPQESLMTPESPVRWNLNQLFAECVSNLGEDHHIRVVYALQTLCGLVRAATKKQMTGSTGYDRINLLVGFDQAEQRMQKLMNHLNE